MLMMQRRINTLEAENRHLHKRLLELRDLYMDAANDGDPWYPSWSEWLEVPEQNEETDR